MQEKKHSLYRNLTYACSQCCGVGNMLMGRGGYRNGATAPERNNAMEFHHGGRYIASVLTEALPFPVERARRSKSASDGTIARDGSRNFKSALTSAIFCCGKLHTALLFLPGARAANCTARGAQLFQTANSALPAR